MRPIATACTLVVLLGAAAFAVASLTGASGPSHLSKKRPAVTITGSVENLHPGIPATMIAQARNNTRRSLVVNKLRVTVKDASELCPQAMLQTQVIGSRHALAPRRTRTIPIRVTLLAGAPDACQDAMWPIRFKVRAKAAR